MNTTPISSAKQAADAADFAAFRAAHRANDRAVMSAYGFDAKMAESDCLAALFRLYEGLAGGGGRG